MSSDRLAWIRRSIQVNNFKTFDLHFICHSIQDYLGIGLRKSLHKFGLADLTKIIQSRIFKLGVWKVRSCWNICKICKIHMYWFKKTCKRGNSSGINCRKRTFIPVVYIYNCPKISKAGNNIVFVTIIKWDKSLANFDFNQILDFILSNKTHQKQKALKKFDL